MPCQETVFVRTINTYVSSTSKRDIVFPRLSIHTESSVKLSSLEPGYHCVLVQTYIVHVQPQAFVEENRA